jgi:hypothetical protein
MMLVVHKILGLLGAEVVLFSGVVQLVAAIRMARKIGVKRILFKLILNNKSTQVESFRKKPDRDLYFQQKCCPMFNFIQILNLS